MRILRLSTSDELLTEEPGYEKGYRIVEQALAAETGEPLETVTRELWPEANVADIVGSWLDRYTPDVVYLKVSSYWWTYQSVPLKLQRTRGRAGRAAARAGFATASTPWLGHRSAFHGFRNAVRRVVGGASYFTADEVVERMSQCIRRVVQQEGILLVVRGGLVAETVGCSVAVQHREEQRRRAVDRALAALCAELHVHYTGCREAPPMDAILPYRGPDRLHQNALGQDLIGREEAVAMVAAWRRAHGADVPLYMEAAVF